MVIDIIEQETNDIDWFFIDMIGNIGFVASGGGRLPNSVANNSEYNLGSYFRNLNDITSYKIIPPDINQNKAQKQYFDFILMAKKGLYCYDKAILGNFDDVKYNLIVKPDKKLKGKDLPKTILEGISKTKLNLDLDIIISLDTDLID